MKMNSAVKGLLPVVLFFIVAFVSGCATAPSVDWSSRVGHYTYAQAVNELGPPDRQIQLMNGATEFRWSLQPATSAAGMNRTGINYNGMNNGPGTGLNSSTGFNNRYLQLTFNANGVLTTWSKHY